MAAILFFASFDLGDVQGVVIDASVGVEHVGDDEDLEGARVPVTTTLVHIDHVSCLLAKEVPHKTTQIFAL